MREEFADDHDDVGAGYHSVHSKVVVAPLCSIEETHLLKDGGFARFARPEQEHFDLALVFVFGGLEGVVDVS